MEQGTHPPVTPVSPAPAPDPERGGAPGPLLAGVAVAVVALLVVIGAAWVLPVLTGPNASATPSSGAPASVVAIGPSLAPSLGPSVAPSRRSAAPLPASTTVPGGPFASAGSMAVVGIDGSLTLVDAAGHSVGLAPASDASLTFPAWSPDGTRIAAIRAGDDHSIVVFDARAAASGRPIQPVVIFRSAVDGPFYLSWTPDGRSVSFLAESTDGLSLRIAPANGSAPLNGTGPGAKIRSGNPLYFDWIERDRLFAHVGTGPFAFLGEMGLDGTPAASAVTSPGEFRAVAVSHDRAYVSYVRAGTAGSGQVVVAKRDGSNERTMPVFGTAGVVFSPTGDTVASIGPTEPGPTAYVIPLGPLRVMDPATGKVRTLLDGSVVSFWWSPDGSTIAALRVQPVAGATPSSPASPSLAPPAGPPSSPSPLPSPTEPPTEVRLLFIDVASGEIGAQEVVRPGQLFIDQFLTYFDQYALSHTIWAPDSSSILIPSVGEDGATRIAVLFRNGDPARAIEGLIGFWSP